MKRILLTLMVFGSFGVDANKIDYEIVPIEPPSDNQLDTAQGLIRCGQLYAAYSTMQIKACAFESFGESDFDFQKFLKSKEFKSCSFYNDYEIRSNYILNFFQAADRIALEENVDDRQDFLFKNNDLHIDLYWDIMISLDGQDSLLQDFKVCMNYRDYVDNYE